MGVGLLSPILRNGTGNRLTWWCPGCNASHSIQHGAGNGPRWGWNGNAERPTFTPSVLVRSVDGWSKEVDEEWARLQQAGTEAFLSSRFGTRCHSYVVDGAMQFLGDCTHALAGQTVPIPPWPRPDWSDG